MRRARRAFVCSLFFVMECVVFAACSLEHLTNGPPREPDGSPGSSDAMDVAQEETATDGGADAGRDVNTLLENGDFERPGVVCAPWRLGRPDGTVESVTPGHDSAQACRVCSTAPLDKLSIYASGPAIDAGLYKVEGWLRVSRGSAPGEKFHLYVDYGNDAGWRGDVRAVSTDATTSWVHVEGAAQVDSPMMWTRFYADIQNVGSDVCFDLDDVLFYAVPTP